MTAIKMYREKAGFTQTTLAVLAGVSQAAIAMWEAGARKPDIVMLKKLAGLLGCTTDELLAPIESVANERKEV